MSMMHQHRTACISFVRRRCLGHQQYQQWQQWQKFHLPWQIRPPRIVNGPRNALYFSNASGSSDSGIAKKFDNNCRISDRVSDSNNHGRQRGGMTVYDSLSGSYRYLPQSTHGQTNANSKSILNSSPISNTERNEKPSSNTKFSTSFNTNGNTANPRGVAWYVCGPTVYDSAHLGHARTYVSLDILRRISLSLHHGRDGNSSNVPRPMYVMNVTDVDDKIINRSMEIFQQMKRQNETDLNATKGGDLQTYPDFPDPLALARHYESEFWADMHFLNVLPPDVICRVSEHVERTIVPYIEQIVAGGMAYVIPESDDMDKENHVDAGQGAKCVQGSVYFDVRAFESLTKGRTKYGKLAPDVASSDFFSWDGEETNNNSNGDRIRKKRDPRDFCLWKYRARFPIRNQQTQQSQQTEQPTQTVNQLEQFIEPPSVSYPSPWGPGRPGWHVECSAMIQRLSEDFRQTHSFEVHAGGVDLKFPHHSNEIAQSEAYNEATTIDDANISSNSLDSKDANGKKFNDFKEWIPHWIHTGHLYVKGRKMSKSLKNFITVREMLGLPSPPPPSLTLPSPPSTDGKDQNMERTNQMNQVDWSNPFHSPSDDFRLWVLGLSGSYRGPATYSKDRMEEARVLREKWVRFLMEGEEYLRRLSQSDTVVSEGDGAHRCQDLQDLSTKLWGDAELELFQTVTQCIFNCRKALLGHHANAASGTDLDGSVFVKELTTVAEVGLAYIENTKQQQQQNGSKHPPEESLRFVLDTLRGQLELVGFTSRTVQAGKILDFMASFTDQAISTGPTGGSSKERLFLDEIVAFRRQVRASAISGMRNKDGISAVKEILKLCDEVRDERFPSLGVEILDGKVAEKSDGQEGSADGEGVKGGWRYCSPRERTKKKH